MKQTKRLCILLCLLALLAGYGLLIEATIAYAAPLVAKALSLNQPFKLPYGTQGYLASEALTIDFVAVTEDSRCPTTVDCVVRGHATITVSLQQGDKPAEQFALDTEPALKRAQGTTADGQYTIALVALDPWPARADQPMPLAQYVATLRVTKGPGNATATATPTALATPTHTPTPLPLATPIRTNSQSLSAPLDAPFVLNVSQTANITGADFHLTLRSVANDSGCFTAADCSTMQFDGTLALQKGDQKTLLDAMVGFQADQPFTTDFAGYTVTLVSIKKIKDGNFAVTFIVADAAKAREAQNPAPPAEFAEQCPLLRRADALAFLQEAVQKQAVTNLHFGPTLDEDTALPGLCGYVSKATPAAPSSALNLPHVTTAVQADHAVVAAQLSEADTAVVLQIANFLHAANPDDASFNLALFKAMLASGDGEGLLERLQELAQRSETIHAEWVEGVAERALWLWQPADKNYFAALLAYDGAHFTVVAGLVGPGADEADAQNAAEAIVQANQPTPTPTSTPTPEAIPTCTALTKAEAEAILAVPVNDEPAPGDEICGYDSVARKAPTGGDALGEPLYFAVAGIFHQDQAAAYLLDFANGLHKENPNADAVTYATIKGLLSEGLIEDAFKLFPALAKGAKTVQVQTVKGLGKNALWLWGRVDGEQFATLIVLDQNDEIIAVFARLSEQRRAADAQANMSIVARKLVARNLPEATATPAPPESTVTPGATVIVN